MVLDKINNNTYLFLLIIILIIILFNMSCFIKNKDSNTTIKKVNLNINNNNNIEQFENPIYIKLLDSKESDYHKNINKLITEEEKKIHSLTIRLKNNNKNNFNLDLLNLENGDLIKISNTELANSDFYLKINNIKETFNKPNYSDIEIIDEKNNLEKKKQILKSLIDNLNNYDNLNIIKVAKKNEFILSYYIKILENKDYINGNDSKYYIKLSSPDKKSIIKNISNQDIVIINSNNSNNPFNKNQNMFEINKVDIINNILFLNDYNDVFKNLLKTESPYNDNNDKEILIKKDYIDSILENYFSNNIEMTSKLKYNQYQINFIKKYLKTIQNEENK